MAANLIKVGDQQNSAIKTFTVDNVDEIAKLPTTERGATDEFANIPGMESHAPMGSQAIVGNETGIVQFYMLFSFGWKALGEE